MDKLVEIKKGQTGTGMLIENDGYISPDDKANKELFESYKRLNEGDGGNEFYCPNPFVVSAVFQKYGIENANGRIYPESVLRKEVEKYMTAIKERRAIGECYTPRAMVLCKDGWKPIADVKEGEEILTLNVETGKIQIQAVTRKIEYKHKGSMIHIKGNNIDDLVTPDHGYPVFGRDGKFNGFYTAEEIYKKKVKDQNHSFIPKQGEWCEIGDDIYILKGIKNPSKSVLTCHPDVKNDLAIPMSTFMKFLGIYLSEGYCRKTNNDVNISQKKENISDEIKNLLFELGLPYTINVSKSGCNTFRICDPRLHQLLSPLGNSYDRYIPSYFKNQSKENLRLLYDWFVKGDGRIRGDKRRKSGNITDDVFSASKRLALDLNEIQLKIGYSGNFSIDKRNYDRKIENRIILAENSHPIYFSLRSLTKGIYLDQRFISIEKEDYEGDVMCVEVPNHTFYVMDGNKCHWSKNCNHPSETVIDLSRTAMNIIELHWEGHTLVGKLEVLTSPGFRKYGIISCQGDQVANLLLSGIKVGVSSRGMGSVTSKMGVMYVGTDYELVCWDFVSTPSTPNAWVAIDQQDLQPFIESKESPKNSILDEKINKALEILG